LQAVTVSQRFGDGGRVDKAAHLRREFAAVDNLWQLFDRLVEQTGIVNDAIVADL